MFEYVVRPRRTCSDSESCPQYLLSVRPLLDDESYARVERLARDFEQTIAVKLQRYLVLKSWCVSLPRPPPLPTHRTWIDLEMGMSSRS